MIKNIMLIGILLVSVTIFSQSKEVWAQNIEPILNNKKTETRAQNVEPILNNKKAETRAQNVEPILKEKKELTAQEIIKKLDSLYRGKSSYAVVEMRIETNYFKRTLEMKMWSKGTENTLVKILKPKKDKGITTLKKGDEIYNYFPKINKVMKVPSSMMMGSWMGSDFTNDDLVKESTYTKDYDFKLVTPDKESEYKLELKPKKTSVSVWGKIIIIIDKKTELPISQEYYDEHNEKIRVMNFKDVKLIGERLLPTTMELIPLSKSKKGNKTSFSYKKIVFDIDLDGNFFGLQNLRNK